MTSISPDRLSWIIEATIDGGGPLNVENMTMSMDMDRGHYCEATLTLTSVDAATWALLDPRSLKNLDPGGIDPQLQFRVRQVTPTGTIFTRLPDPTGGSGYAHMYLRSAERDLMTGVVTVTVAGGETILSDTRNSSEFTIDTGKATVEQLIGWSLLILFDIISLSFDPIVSATPIPPGDRRLMLPGETHMDLLMPELQAINCRLSDYWGHRWYARDRGAAITPATGTPPEVKLATYTQAEGAPADADPIVFEIQQTVSRDGDYADAVIVKYSYQDPATGDQITSYQWSGDGIHTRSRLISYDRAAPADNAANKIVNRTKIRGSDLTVTARARFDIVPGQALTVYLRNGSTVTGYIRSVEWDLAAGTMALSVQSGVPDAVQRPELPPLIPIQHEGADPDE